MTFEKLGVDLLFVDEAHSFKNLKVYTKMSNVAGLTNATSKKATDLLMKIDYINEVTDNNGVVFAIGTPISNAICELYVMQKYLQINDLHNHGIYSFDSWISRFSETEPRIEVKPEGTGYRTVTRVCKYHNLPELMNIFKLAADIRVADQLNLDVPERREHNIAVSPSEIQKAIVLSFAERAEAIRTGQVDRQDDNMLCVTNDGRKVAIDQRLFDVSLPDDPKSKLNRCIRTAYRIWKMFGELKAAQIIFCDMGTPKKNKSNQVFDLYSDVKTKLISFGVPENQIAFIHDANTDTKKTELFDKVNKGEIRFLLGSTEKLGAGTNVQKRLIAIHNIDCPWRPSDLQQRAGRIIRQLNMFKIAHVYSYVTKNTFDTYLYQTVLAKAELISQVISSRNVLRDMNDIDSSCLNYAEIKALSTGNPAIKEKMELEEKVAKLKILRANYLTQKYELEASVKVHFPKEIEATEARIYALKQDIELAEENALDKETSFAPMMIDDESYSSTEKKQAAEHLLNFITTEKYLDSTRFGSYRGFDMYLKYVVEFKESKQVLRLLSPRSRYSYLLDMSDSEMGNITRINNAIAQLPEKLKETQAHLEEIKSNLKNAKVQMDKPFEHEAEYKESVMRLAELNKRLSAEGANGLENIA